MGNPNATRDLATPPAAPANGDRYIVGRWAGKDGKIAAFQDNAWMAPPPQQRWLTWLEDRAALHVFRHDAWQPHASGITSVNPVALIGINTTADVTNRLAVKADAILLSRDNVTPGSGIIHHKLNKPAADTASLLFQDDRSGRAEIGLTGDGDLHVKISAIGASWREALTIDGDSGSVGLPQGSDTRPLIVPRDGDGVVEPLPKGGIFAFSLAHEVYPRAHIAGILSYDCGASPFIETPTLGSGFTSLSATLPTGTTGTASNAGHLYVVNCSPHRHPNSACPSSTAIGGSNMDTRTKISPPSFETTVSALGASASVKSIL